MKDGRARIIDVRPPIEFGICHLPTSTSMSLSFYVLVPHTMQMFLYLSLSPTQRHT